MLSNWTSGTLNAAGFPKLRRESLPTNCLAFELQAGFPASADRKTWLSFLHLNEMLFCWNLFIFPPLFLLQFYFGLAIRAGNKPNVVLLEIFQNCGQSHAALCYVWSHEQANSSISQGRPVWAQLTLLDSPGSLFCQTRRLTPRHLLCQKSLVESAQHARQLLISSCNFSKFPPQNPLQKFSLTP